MNLEQIGELTQNVVDGVESPFKALGMLKDIKDYINKAYDQVAEVAVADAENYENTFEVDGFKFEKRKGSKRFDFKNIEEIVNAKNQVKELEAKYKQAFSSYEKGLQPVTEDGEVLELPRVTYGKDVLIVKFK
jgi:hypothetical protein